MRIQSISTQQLNKKTFGAMPIGQAREIIQNAVCDVFSNGSETDIQEVKIALMQISNIGKHYNGYKTPLLLTYTEQAGTSFIEAETYNNLTASIEINPLTMRSKKFITDLASLLNNSLLGKIAKRRDSKYEAQEIMNFYFGNEK